MTTFTQSLERIALIKQTWRLLCSFTPPPSDEEIAVHWLRYRDDSLIYAMRRVAAKYHAGTLRLEAAYNYCGSTARKHEEETHQ